MSEQMIQLPWVASGRDIEDANEDHIATTYSTRASSPYEATTNAAFIVRAVNSHDALVAALRKLEVAANTAQYCYDSRPENFAFAMSDLAEVAEEVRTTLAAAEAP